MKSIILLIPFLVLLFIFLSIFSHLIYDNRPHRILDHRNGKVYYLDGAPYGYQWANSWKSIYGFKNTEGIKVLVPKNRSTLQVFENDKWTSVDGQTI